MLTSTKNINRSIEVEMYDKRWTDNHSIRIPWLNFLTAQSIPEETDLMNDCSKRQHTDSGCSSTSSEDSYVVLEVQRPRSMVTELDLNFEDDHHVEYDQFAQPMIIETPVKENAVESSLELEYAIVTELVYQINEISTEEQDHNRQTSLDSKGNHCPQISTFSHLSKPEKSIEETMTFTLDRTCIKKLPNTEQLSVPSIRHLIKKCSRKSEYSLLTNEMKSDEPSLFRMKYLDGRPTLIDLNAIESFGKSHTHRKRILNCLQTFLNPPPIDQPKSWQQKTIFELINERKTKRNRY